MTDGPLDLPDGFDEKRSIDVLDLAVRALAILASGEGDDSSEKPCDFEEELLDAVVHEDEFRRHAVISKMIASGITATDIVERYAPRVAARLGSLWVQDKMTFAEVTIGAGRLQEAVRSLGKARGTGGTTVPLGRSILMAVPSQENHMLGAFVAASQFRRMGLWVHMAIGQTNEEMVETVSRQNFEMIGLSAASRRSLPHLTELIAELRENCDTCPPIVVGGQILKLNVDVGEIVGADHTTSNPREAAELCGLLTADDGLARLGTED